MCIRDSRNIAKKICKRNPKCILTSAHGKTIIKYVEISNYIFLDSSMVEHSAVNRVVVGSSPTRGEMCIRDRYLPRDDSRKAAFCLKEICTECK